MMKSMVKGKLQKVLMELKNRTMISRVSMPKVQTLVLKERNRKLPRDLIKSRILMIT